MASSTLVHHPEEMNMQKDLAEEKDLVAEEDLAVEAEATGPRGLATVTPPTATKSSRT